MAKNTYLSIEEAADILGLPQDELTRLREANELRGFADRGTWKFQAEAIEEYRRSRQADSSVDGGTGPSVLDDDDDVAADGPTLIQQSVEDDEPLLLDESSDSDVRLVLDDSLELDDPPPAPLAESNSDVQLVADESPDNVSGSDSDVKLVQSNDPPPLLADDDLAATSIEQPRDVEDLGLTEVADEGALLLEPDDDSGISLETAAESGINLEAADESGISLETAGSDIVLSEQTIADSGISLDTGEESGISLDLDDDAGDETLYEVPALTEDATDFDMDETDDSSGTGVLIFTDEEDAEDYTDTVVKKSGEIDDVFDEFTDIGDDDDLDVVDDELFGEDDELELDVFDADDELFGDDDEEIEDDAYDVKRPVIAHVEPEWGIGAFLPLLASTGLMIACGMVLFELVRSIWGWQDPGFSGTLIETIGDMFN
ncbi:MAG: helix-turn-helix domain-containing protein [Planctomycetaceae bacterium]|nr:helix-turn-helix domain-containing protein [Planctomycetaceae bacterium]